jgi:hypothetical protein
VIRRGQRYRKYYETVTGDRLTEEKPTKELTELRE